MIYIVCVNKEKLELLAMAIYRKKTKTNIEIYIGVCILSGKNEMYSEVNVWESSANFFNLAIKRTVVFIFYFIPPIKEFMCGIERRYWTFEHV